MAYQDGPRNYPGADREEDSGSQYPPPPGEEDRPTLPPVTLPSIRTSSTGYDARGSGREYGDDPRPGNGYRASPPPYTNGYHPQNGQSGTYLPPLQPPQGQRSPVYPRDPRDEYYRQRNGPPYERDPYYYRDGPPPGPGQAPPYGREYGRPSTSNGLDAEYGRPPHGPPHDPDYRGGRPNGYEHHYPRGDPRAPYPPEYPPRGMPSHHQMQQAAPRQRTSIACRYCRKRKIRCSGYANAPGGRCVNCTRMNQECVFQPVSSSSQAAFVHVSAVPGGVPPGTQLYGAYGQPLAHASQAPPYPSQTSPGYYPPPVRSPTEPYSPYPDDRSSSASSRRRRRESDEGHELRLPPPNVNADDDPRRRSPISNDSSPKSQGYPYPESKQPAARSPYGRAPPSGLDAGSHPPTNHGPNGYRGPSPPSGPTSTGSSTPPAGTSSSRNATAIMSLNNLMDGPKSGEGSGSHYDRSMLGRLNRAPK